MPSCSSLLNVTKRIVGRVAVSAFASASRSSYVTLMTADAPHRQRALREVFSGLRYVIRYGIAWRPICRPGLLCVSGRNDGRSPRTLGRFAAKPPGGARTRRRPSSIAAPALDSQERLACGI